MTKESFETFSVDSALLSELGEKLVPTPHLALAELVKNAYDADATEVHISITEDKQHLPEVTIHDNGVGMTLNDIREYWMRIGTTNKVKSRLTPRFGRRKTGAKGIGRFCARRLGRVLELEAVAKAKSGRFEHSSLEFAWDKFRPGDIVTNVSVPCQHRILESGVTGVTLRIRGARENEWGARGFNFLKRQLAILTSNRGSKRRNFEADPGFKVFLQAPDLTSDGVVADLRDELYEAGWGSLEAFVDKEGHAVCSLKALGINGRQQIRSSRPFPGLSDVQLHLAILVEEPIWIRDKTVLSKTTMSEITKEWGGVQVRHLGFRVSPYGSSHDDWLQIDQDRGLRLGKPRDQQLFEFAHGLDGVEPGRSLLNMLSNRSLLGEVSIGPSQKGIMPKADRVGLMDTPEFAQVKAFCRFAIDWAMILRDYAIRLDAHKRTRESRSHLEAALKRKLKDGAAPEEAAKVLRSAIAEVRHYVPEKYAETVTVIERSADFLSKSLKEQGTNLRRLQLVASSATLALFFHHEVKSLLGQIAGLQSEGQRLAKTLTHKARQTWLNLNEELAAGYKNMNDLVQLTSLMGAVGREEQAKNLLLKPRVARCVHIFHRIVDRYGIKFEGANAIPATLGVGPMLEGELFAILINAFSNAIKAVIAGGKRRLVRITAERLGRLAQIEISDTGLGLSRDNFETVFAPLVTDPSGELYEALEQNLNGEDATLLGQGSGLGLSILKSLVEHRNGKVDFRIPDSGWATTLRIQLP